MISLLSYQVIFKNIFTKTENICTIKINIRKRKKILKKVFIRKN